MAHVEVDKVHNLGIDEAMARIARVEEQLVRKYNFTFHWNGHRAEVAGLGTSGEAVVDDVRLRLSINLSLPLRPFKKRIKKLIEDTIDDGLSGKLGDL